MLALAVKLLGPCVASVAVLWLRISGFLWDSLQEFASGEHLPSMCVWIRLKSSIWELYIWHLPIAKKKTLQKIKATGIFQCTNYFYSYFEIRCVFFRYTHICILLKHRAIYLLNVYSMTCTFFLAQKVISWYLF